MAGRSQFKTSLDYIVRPCLQKKGGMERGREEKGEEGK
jgi:hypothetical protein